MILTESYSSALFFSLLLQYELPTAMLTHAVSMVWGLVVAETRLMLLLPRVICPLSVVSNFRVALRSSNDFRRSEEHTSELQSLMRISYAVFCLKKKHRHKQLYHSERKP